MVNVLKEGKGVSIGPCGESFGCKQEACLFGEQEESKYSWSRMGRTGVVADEVREMGPYRPL